MKRLFALVVGLTLGLTAVSAVLAQAPAKKLKIKNFTGQIQIKLADGSIIGVVPGAALPEIPAGAEVVVVSGEATFESGGTVVTAGAGDSFSFNSTNGGVQIEATGTGSEITVQQGTTKATVSSGQAVSVQGSGQGGGELKATKGDVQVETGVAPVTTTTTTTTPTETKDATVTIGDGETAVTQDQVDAFAESIGLTSDQVTVTNPLADESIETQEGIADDVSPSSP